MFIGGDEQARDFFMCLNADMGQTRLLILTCRRGPGMDGSSADALSKTGTWGVTGLLSPIVINLGVSPWGKLELEARTKPII